MFDSDSFDVSSFSEDAFDFPAVEAGLQSVLLSITCRISDIKKKKVK